jgi:hypothetical protein
MALPASTADAVAIENHFINHFIADSLPKIVKFRVSVAAPFEISQSKSGAARIFLSARVFCVFLSAR